MKCPKCKTENSIKAEYCVSCQYPLKLKTNIALICPKCGKSYRGDKQYCTKCQCELIEKTINKSKIIMISSIVAVAIIALSAIGITTFYPRYAFNKAIENNDTTKLVSICREYPDLLSNADRKEQYNSLIVDRTDAYIDDAISYDEITIDFENFGKINSYLLDDNIQSNTEEQKAKVESVYASRLSFDEAENAFSNKEYQKAETKYSEVLAIDEKFYSLSESRLLEISELKQSYLEQSAEKVSVNDYESSLTILAEAMTYFSYDADYEEQYRESIIDSVDKQSDYLMSKELYFSDGEETGAFNLVYSYLNEEQYADNEVLLSKIVEISNASESSELASAEKALGLTNKNKVLDRCSDTAARDYYIDSSIQDDNSYILSLCRNDQGVQELLSNIPKEKQVNVALISDIAMTSDDFISASKEKLSLYSDYTWNYTGIGRYYDEEDRAFSWAVIIIYEME